MKMLTLCLGLLIASMLLWTMVPRNELAFAQSGCCKQRPTEKDPWRESGKTFAACKAVNEELDKDNLFARSGRVWWDGNC
jgi:hypothetical protein